MITYKNLNEVLEANAFIKNKGLTFIESDTEVKYITYSELYNKAAQVLYNLQANGIKTGDKLILQLEDNYDFVHVFWACVLGGIIPVPVTIGNNSEHKLKLLKIFKILNNAYIIASSNVVSKFEDFSNKNELLNEFEQLEKNTIYIENIMSDLVEKGICYKANASDIAFIQFSSGSTGEPKGVVLTHENLLTNINSIMCATELKKEDSSLSWMPLTHDMGLIGFHMTPFVSQIDQYIMPTSLFVRRPTLWLKKAYEYKTTILSSPNFGYRYFLDFFKPENYKEWDFSHVRLILNGAEPISSQLCKEFLNAMSSFKMKNSCMFPVYGLAEASLGVTFPPVDEKVVEVQIERSSLKIGGKAKYVKNDDDSITFVDLGFPAKDCFVEIRDENNRKLDDDYIGYIYIKGKNVTHGYFNNNEATRKAISDDGWLKTGDLGLLSNRRLVVTGRAKDIIFVNGQNFYPHDIERVVEEIKAVQLGRVAACSTFNEDSQGEDIYVFVIYKKDIKKFIPLATIIKRHIKKRMGLEIKQVLPIKKMPKTTSGKVQRFKLSESIINGEFSSIMQEIKELSLIAESKVIRQSADNEIEEKLISIWENILNITNVGINQNFFESGGDSLKAGMLSYEIHKEFDVEFELSDLFKFTTIKEQAEKIGIADKIVYDHIPKAMDAEFYPLSSAQKRLFALNQIEGSNITYNIPGVMEFEGKLDIKRLEYIFNQLIIRHEVLRSSFHLKDGQFGMRVSPPDESIFENFKISYFCLRDGSIDDIVRSFIKPFDLSKAPLMRIGVINVSANKSILLFDMHHIISDGSSIDILLNEFIKLYKGDKLQDLRVQYKDYTIWQLEQQNKKRLKKQKEYWINELSGEIPVLNIPTDFPRGVNQSFDGNSINFILNEEMIKKLDELAKKTSTTLYMILLSVFYVLLYKYSGQEDIILGSPISGRTHSDVKDTIGMFVNTLALRINVSSDMTFKKLLKLVKNKTINAYENQEYQFDALVEQLNIERDMSRNPLFDFMFVLQNTGSLEVKSEEFSIKPLNFEKTISKFDLTLFARKENKELQFELEYCTKLFKKDTIEKFSQHYINILNEVIDNLDLKIFEISMLSNLEKNQLLFEFNDTKKEYPYYKNICELFKNKVEEFPQNVAIECEGIEMTYKELDERSNQLAALLREKGVKKDNIVAILTERSVEAIVAILGVLKSGGAYLPIDPEYPMERIQYMLKDSKTNIILTHNNIVEKINFSGDILDLNNSNLYTKRIDNITLSAEPNSLAYVIYTSGSTGKPKGAMIEHKGLVNYIWWAAKNYLNGEVLNFPLYTSLSFDLTITSIFVPLISGSRIVVYKNDSRGLLIERIFKENKVGVVKVTPAHLELIRNMNNDNSSVKSLIVGGEQLETDLANAINKKFKGKVEIYNEYGPTETVVGCMIHKFKAESDDRFAVPIGIPADNVSIYILDKNMEPVPINVEGEIFISGDGVGRGYLNRAELTKERFIDNPYVKGERMYKTGDIARRLHNGIIEYVGRIDHQVKIRGYRIELGEIENRLLNYNLIKSTVVLAREQKDGNKFICAYFTADETVELEVLREYLLKYLPEYMIPQYFEQLKEIPLTINGKVNRDALPEPALHIKQRENYIPPTSDMEKQFVEVWENVLGIDGVGIKDNFFNMGGDSIKAIQVVSKLEEKGIKIGVRDILSYQTIFGICCNAKLSDTEIEKNYKQGVIDGEIEFTPIVKWFFEQRFNNPNYYNQSILLDLKKGIKIENLKLILNKLIEHHDGLRLNYDASKNVLYYNNAYLNEDFCIMEFNISNFEEKEKQVEIEKIGISLKSSMDISNTILIKAAIIHMGNDEIKLLLTAHHLIVDGISWRIILDNIYNGLKMLNSGKEYTLPKKTASLQEWYKTILDFSKDPDIYKQIEYWTEVYNNEFKLPYDNYDSNCSIKERAIIKGELSIKETGDLLKASSSNYKISTIDILITTLLLSLKEWTQNNEFVIEMEGHGRSVDGIDISRTIGWFTAIYPAKLKLTKKEIDEQIKEVKEQIREIPHQGISYGILKYFSNKLSEQSKVNTDIRFNYLGEFGSEFNNGIFSYSSENTGKEYCNTNIITCSLDINCVILNGHFQVNFDYNSNIFEEETIMRFRKRYMDNLKIIIKNIINKSNVYYTSSDFSITDINQEDLDALLS